MQTKQLMKIKSTYQEICLLSVYERVRHQHVKNHEKHPILVKKKLPETLKCMQNTLDGETQ